MRRPCFEVDAMDAAGRLGRLSVPRADVTIDTPALLPVVNPHLQLIEPRDLAETFGAEILITNAYVFHRSDTYRQAALDRGLHDVLDFPGAIMTDSGSFQLAEYGQIDVETPEILSFQDAIGSDIATPVDVPTPPDVDRETVLADLEQTSRAVETAAGYDAGDMLVTAPVQGSTYPELRERTARELDGYDLDIYPIGAVVPLLTAYRFGDTADIVAAAKRGLSADAPVHLFGAGHPMMFALATALGCDLFDSAAYALYARDGRYLTTSGTDSLDDLAYFPCECPVCVEHTPADLREAPSDHQARLLATHNLHASFAEIRRIKQAIRAGELLELVEARARSHPDLLDGYRAMLAHTDQLEASDPARSARPFFYLSSESADRPEVGRHQARLDRLPVPESVLLVDIARVDEPPEHVPWRGQAALDTAILPADIDPSAFEAWWYVIPPFGPVPPELAYTYPLTAERPARVDEMAYRRAIAGIARIVERGTSEDITFVHDGWPSTALSALPTSVRLVPAPTEGSGRKAR